MKKFDFGPVVDEIRNSIKDENRKAQIKMGSELQELSQRDEDYVLMSEWFTESFGIRGLPLKKIVQISGDSDTGKTSLCIEAMRHAQAQGWGILYCETELKTSKADLEAWGVDPDQLILVQTAIVEEVYDGLFKAWDGFFKKYPNEKLLVIVDSYGNMISQRDAEIDIVKESQKPGGAAKINRQGINKLIAKMNKDNVAALIVNYNYDNMGSHGKTDAGGKALSFFSYLTIRSSRKSFLYAQRNGVQVKIGTQVIWQPHKNHAEKALKDEKGKKINLPKKVELRISEKGISLV